MAIVPMQKVAVVAHKSKQEELLQFLQKEGVLEITNMREPTAVDHTEVRFRSGELAFAIDTLTPYASKELLEAASKKVSEQVVIHAAEKTDVFGIIQELHRLEHDDTELNRLRDAVSSKPSNQEAVPALEDMNAAQEPAYFSKTKQLKEDLSHYGITYIHGKGKKEEMDPVAIEALQKDIDAKLESHVMRRKELAKQLPHLVHVQTYIQWLDQKQAAREALVPTRHTVTLFGWIKTKMFGSLEKKLHAEISASAVLKINPEEGEEPPVAIENSTLIRPFESVTTLYGLPTASEVDPTPLLAPFFILFFGLCLTDAGYGLVLAIIMGVYLFRSKKTISQAPLWWLLMLGGVFTFFVSIPFGGWFGLTVDQAPSFMVERRADDLLWFKGQVWNLGETKGITFFQNLALILGIIHLSFGMLIAGVLKVLKGNIAEGFWNDFTAVLLILVAAGYFFVPAEMKQVALYAIYVSVALLIWGKGYGKTWYLRPLFGLLGFMNFSLGMLSNTLSYLRLLALGLVTGALALAVNLVAIQLGELLPTFLAIPVMIVIVVVGHTANIALNTMGAFIHSGRLQFVEFFSQFFEGGGRQFKPFTRFVRS